MILGLALLAATELLGIHVEVIDTMPSVWLVFQSAPDTFQVFTLPDPPRLVIDFPKVRYRPVFRREVNRGILRRIRGSTTAQRLRIVLDLDRLPRYEIQRRGDTLQVLLRAFGPTRSPRPTVPRPLYASRGKRDPFQPPPAEPDTLFDPTTGRFTGVLFGPEGPIALVQDADGRPFVLQEGSRVKRGVVVKIEEDRVIFALSHLGTTRRYVLKRGKEVP